MLLFNKDSDSLVEINDVTALINPSKDEVPASDQAGQEEQETYTYKKQNLIFPSGETLPRCWIDPNYRSA